jgi:hypothetical protein
MNDRLSSVKVLGIACICVLCIILTAGLWPFHAPRNDVDWLVGQKGLRFGRHGSIVTSGAIQIEDPKREHGGAWSLEIWLEPDANDTARTILSFYNRENSIVPLSLHQFRDLLVLWRDFIDRDGRPGKEKLAVGGVFSGKKRVFLTITSGPSGATVYVNGVFAETFPTFQVSSAELKGDLVLANFPTASNSWPGEIFGLALYNLELRPSQIAQHYEDWTGQQQPLFTSGEAPVGLYLFNERKGNAIHNLAGTEPGFLIPKQYFILHATFLEAAWREFHPTRSYLRDVTINVIGFVPFGFCFYACLSSSRAAGKPFLTTLVLGFAVSLTIEVSQAYLPTRNSGTTDLVTNTLGTVLGALFSRSSVGEVVLDRALRLFCEIPAWTNRS